MRRMSTFILAGVALAGLAAFLLPITVSPIAL